MGTGRITYPITGYEWAKIVLESHEHLTGKNFFTFVPQQNLFRVPKRFKPEKQVSMQEFEYHSSLISKI